MRELRPSPVKVEESVSGALLGLLGVCNTDAADFGSTFGLEENSDDIICVCWRGLGCASGTERDATDRRSECFRGRLDGRSSTVFVFAWEWFWVRALRFSILFDLSLKAVSKACHIGLPNTPLSPPTTFLGVFPPGRWPFLKRKIQHQSITHGIGLQCCPQTIILLARCAARPIPILHIVKLHRCFIFLLHLLVGFPPENQFLICERPRLVLDNPLLVTAAS
jgi:hypothetical protein